MKLLVLLVAGAAAKFCLPASSFFQYISVYCLPEGSCCQNNLECFSGCCDKHTARCNPESKTKHFLENFPYSTACQNLPMNTYDELNKIIEYSEWCKNAAGSGKTKVLLWLYIVSQIVGWAYVLYLIYCSKESLKKRDQQVDLEVEENLLKMREKIGKLGGDLELAVTIVKLKNDAWTKEPKGQVLPTEASYKPMLDYETDRKQKNGRDTTWPGKKDNPKNGPLLKPKKDKWDITISDPAEPATNCVSSEPPNTFPGGFGGTPGQKLTAD